MLCKRYRDVDAAKADGVVYTPRPLADFLLPGSSQGHPAKRCASWAASTNV